MATIAHCLEKLEKLNSRKGVELALRLWLPAMNVADAEEITSIFPGGSLMYARELAETNPEASVILRAASKRWDELSDGK